MRPIAQLLVVPVLLAAAPQGAMVEPTAPCPSTAAPPPASLAAWRTGLSLAAATDRKSLVSAKLRMGTRREAMLASTDTVRFVLTPTKPSEPTSKAGMLAFTVARAGTYRVLLGTGAWIDVVRHGKALTAVAHAHGQACSGIHKMVDFALVPGRYVLQIEGSKDAAVPVLVIPLP